MRDAHSLYLETLAELGMVGLLILLIFLAGSLRAAWLARKRLRRSSDVGAVTAMLAAFIVFMASAGVDWMWEVPAVTVFALSSLTVAIASASRRWRSSWRFVNLPARVAAGVVAIAVGAVQVPGIVSTDRIRDSEGALESGDPPLGLALAGDAVDAQPWAAAPHVQRALALSVLDLHRDAGSELAEATEREPTNWRHPLLRAVLEFERGDRDAAGRSYRRARVLRPGLPLDPEPILRALARVDLPSPRED